MLCYQFKEYLDEEPTHRRPEDAVIITVKQGDEPESFIDLFPEWDHAYFEVGVKMHVNKNICTIKHTRI